MTTKTLSSTLGKTGLEVHPLGIGLFEIGELAPGQMTDDRVSRLLNTALDQGVTFLDTAACYGISEDLIGKTVSHRRDEIILATKCGHVVSDIESPAWSAETVRRSVERSLQRLNTDHLDILQIHSCDMKTLERGEIIEALQRARQEGKTRFIGFSGDNEAADWAVDSGVFDTLQTSFNMVDQRARRSLLPSAHEQNMGVIVKRPIGNMVWGALTRPGGSRGNYFERAQDMAAMGPITGAPDDPVHLGLGFVFAHDEIDVAIVGTTNPDHLRANLEIVERKLPIPQNAIDEIHRRFDVIGDHLPQQQ